MPEEMPTPKKSLKELERKRKKLEIKDNKYFTEFVEKIGEQNNE